MGANMRRVAPRVLVGLGAALLGAAVLATGGCGGSGGATRPFDPNVLTVAVPDPTDDFVTPAEGSPPGGVVAYSPNDLTNVELGADDDYLYVRTTLAGDLPAAPPEVGGFEVRAISINIAFDLDQNPSTGCPAEGGTEARLTYQLQLVPLTRHSASWLAQPTGLSTPVSARYGAVGSATVLEGGPGLRQVTLRAPLAELGITRGQPLDVLGWVESRSADWPRLSYDELTRTAVTHQ